MTIEAVEAEAQARRRRRRRLRRLLLFIVIAAIPRFFFELHRVDGTSMWPAFNEDGKGEWLLVLKSWVDREPEVWDPVVVRDPDDSDRTVLKRLCAGPDAYSRIEDGDLRVLDRDTGLEDFVARSLDQIVQSQIPVASLSNLEIRQQKGSTEIIDGLRRTFIKPIAGRLALSDDGQHLLIEAGAEGLARARLPEGDFVDDHRNPQGRVTAGTNVVRDIGVTLAFARILDLPVGQKLELQHVFEAAGDHEDLILERVPDGLQIITRGRGDLDFETTLALVPGLALRWLNVDDHRLLMVSEDGSEEAFRLLSDKRRDLLPSGQRSFLNLELHGGSVVLSRLDISRDLHYTPALDPSPGGPGEESPLPQGRNLLLGDNSPSSRDSRQWPRDARIEWVGRPVLAVWPWSRVRLLD